MATLTISDISERLLQALEARAAEHGHGVEAEALLILESSALSGEPGKLGSLLAEIGQDATLTDEEFAVFDQLGGRRPPGPVHTNALFEPDRSETPLRGRTSAQQKLPLRLKKAVHDRC